MGEVIARRGTGINAVFTVRRIVNNEGWNGLYGYSNVVSVAEAPGQSRALLYYLRHRVGKA